VSLLLESVSQPFNLGAILRTAAAFGVEHVWLCGDTADPAHPGALRTALGAGRFLSVRRATAAGTAAAEVRAAGLRLIAIELAEPALPLHAADLAGDVCLALGHEDRGCSPALLGVADQIAYIPQPGRIGSLNVAAAAAIALAEARRREWAQLPDAGAGVPVDSDRPDGEHG